MTSTSHDSSPWQTCIRLLEILGTASKGKEDAISSIQRAEFWIEKTRIYFARVVDGSPNSLSQAKEAYYLNSIILKYSVLVWPEKYREGTEEYSTRGLVDGSRTPQLLSS